MQELGQVLKIGNGGLSYEKSPQSGKGDGNEFPILGKAASKPMARFSHGNASDQHGQQLAGSLPVEFVSKDPRDLQKHSSLDGRDGQKIGHGNRNHSHNGPGKSGLTDNSGTDAATKTGKPSGSGEKGFSDQHPLWLSIIARSSPAALQMRQKRWLPVASWPF